MSSKSLTGSPRTSSPCPSEDDSLSMSSPKRGRKESEQRRRVMMNQYFDELIALLSMLSERCIPKKMDKATTLHEAVQCIQVYSDLTSKPDRTLTLDIGKTSKSSTSKGSKSPSPCQSDTSLEGSIQGLHTVGELLHFFLDAEDSFLLVVSDSGRVLFSTELVTSLLGHMQTRLVGQNFFDFVHENDHKIFQDIFKSDQSEGIKLKDRPIIGFPPKLVHCHLKLYAGETGYFPQYLQFKSIVYLRKWDTDRSKERVDLSPGSPNPSLSESGLSLDQGDNQSCLVLVGKLPTSLSMIDLPVGTNEVNFEFDMRVSREGRIIDIDKHAVTVLGFTSSEIIGTSFFEYIDPYHLSEVSECMSTFLTNGLGTTTPYRLLTKGERAIWLMSKGYLSYNPWNNKPDHILLTNRVLGCDQVLPEHRFFRSRRLLPDLEGHEWYVPQIPVCRASSPPPASVADPTPSVFAHSAVTPTTADSAVVCDQPEKLFDSSDLLGEVSQQHHHQQYHHRQQEPPSHQQHLEQPTQQLHQFQPPAVGMQQQSLQQHGQIPQPGVGGGGQQQILQTTQSTPTGPSAQTPVTPSPLQGGIGIPGFTQSQVPMTTETASIAPPPPPQAVAQIQSFEDIQRELDRKNREIFEMQKKLFEQQQLFEKERSQFYSITAQVMQCIGSSTLNTTLTPSMQMVFSTSSDYNQPSLLNTQSKMMMDSPLQPNTQDAHPYTMSSVPPVSCTAPVTPLWDSRAQMSLGPAEGYTDNSHQFSLHSSHQQPSQHAQQQHQIHQPPYGGTPTTTLPVSTVNFTSDYVPVNTSSMTYASPMSHNHQLNSTPSVQQFGLSQAFKMSGHQSLAEHNLQFFHHPSHGPPPPHPPHGLETTQHQQQHSGPVGQTQQTHIQPPSASHTHAPGPPGVYGGLSNLTSSLSSSLSLPTLPVVGMHSQKSQPQQPPPIPSPNLADILNSARFS